MFMSMSCHVQSNCLPQISEPAGGVWMQNHYLCVCLTVKWHDSGMFLYKMKMFCNIMYIKCYYGHFHWPQTFEQWCILQFIWFLRSEMKFSKLLVQPPHHLVTCAHDKNSLSFFWTSFNSFAAFMQSIMYICLRFPTLSIANFIYFATRSWNQLPEEIRCAKILATFKSRLKMYLFSCAFVEWALCYIQTDWTV